MIIVRDVIIDEEMRLKLPLKQNVILFYLNICENEIFLVKCVTKLFR